MIFEERSFKPRQKKGQAPQIKLNNILVRQLRRGFDTHTVYDVSS